MSRHDELTRSIYQKQHERISGNDAAADRIFGMYDKNSFGLDPDWFKGKQTIDIGCGNIGSMIVRLINLGVGKCWGADIDSEWIEPLAMNLRARGIADSKFQLETGSVTKIQYDTGSFDFVSVNGVLIHLENMDEIVRGFREAARITKQGGGVLYTSWGPCGGLMQGVIMPAVRAHYRKDAEFKAFIDNVAPDQIHTIIDKIVADTAKYSGEKLDANFLKSLFGVDYCVFLQNFIQAPTWWSNECTPEFVEGLYREAGFRNVRRLKSFTKRSDIRKFFAPLHYDLEHPFSKILYGQGYVQYVGEK
jgi:ubiquinone/menaquinone biosynthesis C-methylase UbiE